MSLKNKILIAWDFQWVRPRHAELKNDIIEGMKEYKSFLSAQGVDITNIILVPVKNSNISEYQNSLTELMKEINNSNEHSN